MKTKVTAVASGLIYAMFTMCFIWVTAKVLVGSYYEYEAPLLIACTIGFAALFVGAWFLFGRLESKLKKAAPYLTLAVVCLMAFVQIYSAFKLRYEPKWDLGGIYNGAVEWAETGDFAAQHDYFCYFFNNFGSLVFLRVIFGAARLIGLTDYFIVASAVNGLLCLLMIVVTCDIARQKLGTRGQLMATMLFFTALPLYFIAPTFYTDALSLIYPALIYWLYLKVEKKEKLRDRLILYALIGVVAAIGYEIKPTVLIMAIAVVIDALVKFEFKRALAVTVSTALSVLLLSLAVNGIVYSKLDRQRVNEVQTPVLHWVMMGLKGNGIYNGEDYEFTRSFKDPDERRAAIKQEIKRRIAERGFIGMVELLTEKADITFGDGTYGLSDFLCFREKNTSVLHEYLVKGEKNYKTYSNITTGALLAVYILIIAGGAYEVFSKESKTRELLVPRLALLGLFIFLLCWEARWRYFSNYIPIIFLSAVIALGGISTAIERRRGGDSAEKPLVKRAKKVGRTPSKNT